MFLKWLSNITDKLTIQIGEQSIVVRSPEEFSFCCSGRTELPSKRLATIAKDNYASLADEINKLHKLDEIMKAITEQDGIGVGTGIRHTFSDISISSISSDHHWREIFESLRGKPPKYDSLLHHCRRIAIDDYRLYIGNRCNAIDGALLALRNANMRHKKEDDSKEELQAFSPKIVETGLGDVHYERIPRGETVTIHIRPGEDLDLLLSRHKCKLIQENEKLKFVSNAQHDPIPIHPGRTAIGRDTINDIVLDSAWRDVSRLHLVINHNGSQLQITDMSSYGTFLPTHLIGRAKEALH